MKRFIAAVAVILAVGFPISLAADANRGAVVQGQQSGADKFPGRFLRALLFPEKPKKGLTPSDVSYSRSWVDAQPKAAGDAEWRCLSEALYFEARGETVKGQFAVAEVIVNRVKSGRFPGTVCGVINQGTGRKFQCQFTYTCDGRKDVVAEPLAYERVAKVARAVLDGAVGNLTGGATHYHTIAVRPAWARTYTKTAQIGVHIFYRDNYRTASNE